MINLNPLKLSIDLILLGLLLVLQILQELGFQLGFASSGFTKELAKMSMLFTPRMAEAAATTEHATWSPYDNNGG